MTATAGPERDKDNPGYGDCRCGCHWLREDGGRIYHATACCYPEPAPLLRGSRFDHANHRTPEDLGQSACFQCFMEARVSPPSDG